MHAPTNLAPAREEACDWSGWEKWLESHLAIEREALAIERKTLLQALGEVLGESRFDLRNEIEAKINAQVKELMATDEDLGSLRDDQRFAALTA